MGRAKSQTERNEAAKRKRKIISALQWVLAIIVMIIVVFPIYWMLVSSVKSQEEILLAVPTLWPKEFHFENYINVLKRRQFCQVLLQHHCHDCRDSDLPGYHRRICSIWIFQRQV